MTSKRDIPESLLHLFVDGELDAADNERILQAIENDGEIRTRVGQLQHLKARIKNHYPLEPPPRYERRQKKTQQRRTTVAASLLLLLAGILLGWAGHGLSTSTTTSAVVGTTNRLLPTDDNRILLHIDDSDHDKLKSLLAYTERLLRNNPKNLQIEVIANASGLDIFRKDGKPETLELRKLVEQYNNLKLFACANALSRLREKGIEIDLIPEVQTNYTALERIIRRMREGWQYHKI